jgi:rhamnosyltransferase
MWRPSLMPSSSNALTAPKPSRHCAVVVTFNPDLTALLKLLSQLEKDSDFIVLDNGSKNIDEVAASIEVYSRCRAIEKIGENIGLARALNKGIAWVKEHGYEFVFLFDQDSRPGDMFARGLIEALERASKLSKKGVAAVGPRIMNPQSMKQTPFKLFDRLIGRTNRRFEGLRTEFEADFLITSGTLIPLTIIEAVGAMRDDYFIDNIDLEWCFRAKAMGYDLIGSDASILYHAIGERSAHPWVRAGLIAHHNPSRSYYSSRNRVHLYGVDYAPLGWKLRDAPRFALKALWLFLSSRQRFDYFSSIRQGIRDAGTLPR